MAFKAFLDACPLGIFILDAQGHPYYANLKAIDLLGKGVLPQANLEQLNVIYQAYQAGTNQLYPLAEHPLLLAFQGETNTVTDLEIHQGGQIIPIELTASPIFDSQGTMTFVMAILQDLRERQRQAQQQEQFRRELIRRNQGLQQENDSLKAKLQQLSCQK
ncbi:PAS domain S-box protein [Synechocystis sp. LKSZ1]|uniref:PAS domain S-box protein n=1 Tax=Synechocystis sp. LKSZ1 TaxID=3144951 RepID=UPI00336BD079